ncbi:hypothetical protein A1OO_10745 [Enterovibrio norvegicus FF-33]|nr:hypothetical protein A1OO_10745 [Enterovibrio norvegicus FF-33]
MEKQKIWETYASAWKAESKEEKIALFRQSMNENVVYTDPLIQTETWDDLLQYMLDFHQQVDGGHFVTTYFMSHHNKCLAKWNMCDREGHILGEGISIGEYNDEGQLVSATGFFELPEQG